MQRHQEGLEEKMKGNESIFDNVDLLYNKLNKKNLNRGGSFILFPEISKNTKATLNPKNNDDKCFLYALLVALNYDELKVIQKEYQILNLFLISMIGKN